MDRHTQNARAYEFYLKGRFYWTRRYHGGADCRKWGTEEDDAEEDAGYALAFAGLADAYAFIGIYAVQRPRLALGQGNRPLERALALNPDLPRGAHFAGLHQDGRSAPGPGRRRAQVARAPSS